MVAVEAAARRKLLEKIFNVFGHEGGPIDDVPKLADLGKEEFGMSSYKCRRAFITKEYAPGFNNQGFLFVKEGKVRSGRYFDCWEGSKHLEGNEMKGQEFEDIVRILVDWLIIEVDFFEKVGHCILKLMVHRLAQLGLDYAHDFVVLLQA